MAISFQDQNLIRTYPFVANVEGLIPNEIFVDAKFSVLQGDFDPASHRIYLAWVARFGGRIRFGFRTDCPDLIDHELVFEADVGTSRYTTLYAVSTPSLENAADRCGCGPEVICNAGFAPSSTTADPGDELVSSGAEMIGNPLFGLV